MVLLSTLIAMFLASCRVTPSSLYSWRKMPWALAVLAPMQVAFHPE